MPVKTPIGSKVLAFSVSEDMHADLDALRSRGVNRGSLVRKLVDLLDEQALTAVESWPPPPRRRGLKKSRTYQVTDEQKAKIERLRSAGVPVYDLIRHGLAVHIAMPDDMLLSDDSILLTTMRAELKKKRDRKRRASAGRTARIQVNRAIQGPIFESYGMDRAQWLRLAALAVRRGRIQIAAGEHLSEAVAAAYGLTPDETTAVIELSQDSALAGAAPSQSTGGTAVQRGTIRPFSATDAIVASRSDTVESVRDTLDARGLAMEDATMREIFEKGLGAFPNTSDLPKCRRWLEEAARMGRIPATEIESLWLKFLGMKEDAEKKLEVQAILRPPTPIEATVVTIDRSTDGRAYVSADDRQLAGCFTVPVGADFDSVTADLDQRLVSMTMDDGRRITLPLEPVDDAEQAALGEAMRDHAAYELLKTELESRFGDRGDEQLTEQHMAELYSAARNRLFRAIDSGELDGLGRADVETILARTMLRMRREFGLPAFGLIDNSDVERAGDIEARLLAAGADPKDAQSWVDVEHEGHSQLCNYCGNAAGLKKLARADAQIIVCGTCLVDDELGRGEGLWVGIWKNVVPPAHLDVDAADETDKLMKEWRDED